MRFTRQLVDDLAEHRRARHLLVADRHDDQDRRGADSPGEEGHQPQAHLVGPVNVLQHDDDRLLRGEAADQLRRGLEEQQVIGRMSGGLRAFDLELGQQARQLRAPERREAAKHLDLRHHASVPKRIDPGAERQHLFGLVGAAEQDPDPARVRFGGQRHEEAALADPCLAGDGDDLAITARRLLQCLSQADQLDFASDERRVGRDELGARLE